MEFLFWIFMGLLAQSYLLYPLSLPIIYTLLRPKRKISLQYQPKVSILIAAYNEEKIISDKIENCLQLDYPRHLVEILVGSDGSSDQTISILKTYEKSITLRLFDFSERRGKAAVLNDLMYQAQGEILVLCDANTLFLPNSVSKLVSNFPEEKVGCVCGKLVLKDSTGSSLGRGESIYWSFESELKLLEGKLGIVMGANGGIYALRKKLAPTLPVHKTTMDDFFIATHVLAQGYEVVYEPMAMGTEETSLEKFGEFRRKIRIGQANFNHLSHFLKLLNPRHPLVAYSFFSHKLMRWFGPFFIFGLFPLNLGLSLRGGGSSLYTTILACQIILYTCGVIGYFFNKRDKKTSLIFSIPFYFLVMNYALILGFLKSFNASSGGTWERVERAPAKA